MVDKKSLPDVEVMSSVLAERKQTNSAVAKQYKTRHYKEASDEHRDAEITRNLHDRIDAFRSKAPTGHGKTILRDFDTVQKRTFEYLESCEKSATIPSLMGLASLGFGISRQAVNAFLKSYPDHPSAEWLEAVREYFIADVLADLSLKNQINGIMSIFILKNTADMADKHEISAVIPDQPLGQEMDRQTIIEALPELPDFIDED